MQLRDDIFQNQWTYAFKLYLMVTNRLIIKLRQNSTETAYKKCWLFEFCTCWTVNDIKKFGNNWNCNNFIYLGIWQICLKPLRVLFKNQLQLCIDTRGWYMPKRQRTKQVLRQIISNWKLYIFRQLKLHVHYNTIIDSCTRIHYR